MSEIAKERADWLLDAIATATQDRRFLRGDPAYDEVVGEAVLLNAEKAIGTAVARTANVVTPDMLEAARRSGPNFDDRTFTQIYLAMRQAASREQVAA